MYDYVAYVYIAIVCDQINSILVAFRGHGFLPGVRGLADRNPWLRKITKRERMRNKGSILS
jgi:hypothetical protein